LWGHGRRGGNLSGCVKAGPAALLGARASRLPAEADRC